MKPCLAQVCSLSSSFEADIEDYAAGQCFAVEAWFTKLENYLKTHSIESLQALLKEHEVILPVASFQGGLLASQGDQRAAAWRLFDDRIALCQQLKVQTIVVACDVPSPLTQSDIDRVTVSLVQVAQRVGAAGLSAALEFQSNSALGNNLQTAAALVADAASPHLGICLDAMHFFTGPSKTEDLALLSKSNLFHVQLCDLADTPRELASDSQRILPGDGDFPLPALIQHLKQIDYDGYVSIELMNPQIWQIPPRSFGEIALTALRKVLGQASMG
jgi:2-keto-myo-inositol isomerase